jgi:hypothetical protein
LKRRLDHESGEALAFYRSLQGPVRVGIEATGPIHWFERALAELGHELWVGDSAKIRASEVERDSGSFSICCWQSAFRESGCPRRPNLTSDSCSGIVTARRLRIMLGNQLHFLAMSQGLCRKKKLFTKNGRGELTGLGPVGEERNF